MKVRISRSCLRLDSMPRRFWRCLSELDQSLFYDQASDSVLVPLGQDGARLRTRQPLKLPNNSVTLVTTTANSLREGKRDYPPEQNPDSCQGFVTQQKLIGPAIPRYNCSLR